MVNKIINFLSREVEGLHQAAYLLAFFSLLSTILALFRDRLLAYYFGAGENLDIYYSAFRIPDIIFVTVASMVGASVLIPFIISKIDEGRESLAKFINSIWTFYFVLVVLFSVIMFFLSPFILKLLFPIFYKDKEIFSLLVYMTRILLLSPIFLGLSNLFSSITQVYKRFFIYALSPVFYNIGIILGIVFLYPIFGLKGLAFGVVFGAFLHFAIQIPFVKRENLFPKFIKPDFASIKKVVFVSLPRTITLSSSELSELVLVSLASFLFIGSVSIFNFSFNLQSVPYSIIGISYSLAVFPTLTRFFSSGQRDKFLEQMLVTSKHIIFWSVPVSVFLIVLRAQIVRTILGSGRFDWNDTRLTSAALAIWTISLLAQNLSTLFVRSFYSRGKTKEPLYINIVGSFIIIIFSYLFILLFQKFDVFAYFIESIFKVSGLDGTVVLMLPLGYSIGMIITMLFHILSFRKEFRGFVSKIFKTFFQVFGASIIGGFICYKFLFVFDNIFDINTFIGIFLQGLFSGLIGVSVFMFVLVLLSNQELKDIFYSMKGKIWKSKIIAPEAEM